MSARWKKLTISIIVIIFVLLQTLQVCDGTRSQSQDERKGNAVSKKVTKNRTVPSPFINPLAGVWHSASRMLGQGVHKFRQSLHEGVKVAHMLKEDVDEGVSRLLKQTTPLIATTNNKDHASSSSSSPDSSLSQHPSSTTQVSPAAMLHPDEMEEQQLLREGMLGGLLRFMGVNSNHVGVIALNVLIILAEWVKMLRITSALIGKDENGIAKSRMVKHSLTEWITKGHNSKIEKMLQDAKSKSLPENIIDTLKGRTGNSTSCVQLLICKMTPVIWGIQETVKQQLHSDNATNNKMSSGRSGFSAPSIMNVLKSFVPSKDAFVTFGDDCELKFPSCQLLKIPKRT